MMVLSCAIGESPPPPPTPAVVARPGPRFWGHLGGSASLAPGLTACHAHAMPCHLGLAAVPRPHHPSARGVAVCFLGWVAHRHALIPPPPRPHKTTLTPPPHPAPSPAPAVLPMSMNAGNKSGDVTYTRLTMANFPNGSSQLW